MAGTEMKNVVLIALVVLLVVFVVYQYDPSLFGLFGSCEGFESGPAAAGKLANAAHGNKPPASDANGKAQMVQNSNGNQGLKNAKMSPNDPSTMATKYVQETPLKGQGALGAPQGGLGLKKEGEGFADLSAYEGPANFGAAEAPAGCYPRDQLTPTELLPRDMNSIWAEQNPMGPGSLKGKNFLSAGALIGVNTVGQSLRNANLQIRSEPPNPQVPVSIFNQSTISPDISHRPLEVGA